MIKTSIAGPSCDNNKTLYYVLLLFIIIMHKNWCDKKCDKFTALNHRPLPSTRPPEENIENPPHK